MSASAISRTLRIAVEGCGHGTLNKIYSDIGDRCRRNGWNGIDLLIIGGDFQAARNGFDLNVMAIPPKYRKLADFHEYYSGKRVAPYLTVFVGGNHEASNYLFELYYGGWVAPNIYYLGAANVLRLGPLRIAGLSGIWKGYNYNQPHFERLPYSEDDKRSIYHVRALDVRKLLQIRTQVDIGISHDWPRGIERCGDLRSLLRKKDYFEEDVSNHRLGSTAAKLVLDRLKPPYWFSGHLHVKYSAVVNHPKDAAGGSSSKSPKVDRANHDADDTQQSVSDSDKTALAGASNQTRVVHNEDEIDLDIDFEEAKENEESSTVSKEVGTTSNIADVNDECDERPAKRQKLPAKEDVSESLPSKPPASSQNVNNQDDVLIKNEITNMTTNFLALDKCLPNRSYLDYLEIKPYSPSSEPLASPLGLSYDKEWLAITRVFASELQLSTAQSSMRNVPIPPDKGEAAYRSLIVKEEEWVEENLVQTGKMEIPKNFTMTAPLGTKTNVGHKQPTEYTNPQTAAFCKMLEISNEFDMSEEDRLARMERGPDRRSHFSRR